MSLHADYIKELRGDGIIESENGFLTYKLITFDSKPAIYAMDGYVTPSKRKSGLIKQMLDEVILIGIQNGCHTVVSTVAPSSNWSTANLKIHLSLGMVLHSASADAIIFKKEI